MSFNKILEKYRKTSLSQHEKGIRFEKLMQAYLRTDPMYTGLVESDYLPPQIINPFFNRVFFQKY